MDLRLAPSDLANLDRIRGGQSRGAWMRDMLRCVVLARDAFDGPCAIRMRAVAPDEGGADGPSPNGPQVWDGEPDGE